MMAGVVRKKRRRKRTMLMIRQRIHQENPPTDRCSLREKGYVAVTWHWAKTRSYSHSWPVNWYCSSKTQVDWSLLLTRHDIKSITNQQVFVCRIPFEHKRWRTFDLPKCYHPFQFRICDLNVFLPVHVLWIRGVADSPVVSVELGAELRALGLPTTLTSLTLASIKVFQDSAKTHPPTQRTDIKLGQELHNQKPIWQIHIHSFYHMQVHLHGGYWLVLEGDKGHS